MASEQRVYYIYSKPNTRMTDIATFAGGCFWCLDAIFRELRGVEKVESGFAGGEGEIDYNTIHARHRGYSEAVQITFDPTIIPYTALLDIFWHMHNPTELNRQGPDTGYEYRSAIFYHSDEQKHAAEESKNQLAEEKEYIDPITTTIEPYTTFVPADEEHQNFYNKNKMNPYCMYRIDPKLAKLRETYRDVLKS